MTGYLIVLAMVVVAMALTLAIAVLRAPHGYETERGFHAVERYGEGAGSGVHITSDTI